MNSRIPPQPGELALGILPGAELDQLQTDQNDLLDRITADPLFPLSREELEEMLDPRAFIGCCPSQVTRFLKDTVQPVVDRWGAKETLTAKLEV